MTTRQDLEVIADSDAGETLAARIARLKLTTKETDDERIEQLRIAHNAGVDDESFSLLLDALYVSRGPAIELPAHRLESMSQSKGWCRLGHGDSAVWGKRIGSKYRVDKAGLWTVHAKTGGYHRVGNTEWRVEHIAVGSEIWTVAS